MMRVRLLQALMVDGRDRPAGEVVELVDDVAREWIGQGLAEPAPAVVERAVVEPGQRADGPSQGRPPARKRPGGGS